MNAGVLDWPAPLWSALDSALALALPGVLRVLLYALVSAWLCMTIYRRLSRQQELADISAESRRLRAELAGYDGPFDGLMQRVRRLLGLNGRHLRLSFVPALLAGLPLLLLMPWLSNQFGSYFPTAGTPIQIVPEELSVAPTALIWTTNDVRWDEQAQAWTLPWPSTPVSLRHGEQTLLTLPMPAPAALLHPRVPSFNWLIGNPAGYLPETAPMAAVHLDLPEQELLPIGPGWLRGWLAIYLIAMVIASLYLKWRWKLQ